VLRHCLPASIRQTLDQLPESLDETYLRVLSQIPQTNQAHAHRMLQCLMVAIRPLRVEELAELLAFEFDMAQSGIPKYHAAWRLDDRTQAVLSTCPSLVTIVVDEQKGHEVVQFSHFSVKEFLMSNRLGGFSRYHIRHASAHTILTQACLSSLLHLVGQIDKRGIKCFPLAKYAAHHWVEHAQFEDVASQVKDGMELLFDPDEPHLAAWIQLYDIDRPKGHWSDSVTSPPKPNPVYYSVLSDFYNLVKHLAIKHPQHVNAIYGRYRYPLFAALRNGRIEVAELLLEHGANVNAMETTGETILLRVVSQFSSSPQETLWSRLRDEVQYERPLEAAQMLVRYNADINSQDGDGRAPLHMLSESQIAEEAGALNLTLLLLKHGAQVNTRDKKNQTPLHLAMGPNRFEHVEILLEHGADIHAENINGKTALHLLSESWIDDEVDVINLALLLLKHGAEVNVQDRNDQSPLHLAVGRGQFKLAVTLLQHSADPNAEDDRGETPLRALWEPRIEYVGRGVGNVRKPVHQLSRGRYDSQGRSARVAHLLSECSANIDVEVDTQDETHDFGLVQMVQALLDHGANVNAGNNGGGTRSRTFPERQHQLQITRKRRRLGGQRPEGKYYIQCNSLGLTRRRLTRAWRRCARTK
jgi:ankyrin repeat protein